MDLNLEVELPEFPGGLEIKASERIPRVLAGTIKLEG